TNYQLPITHYQLPITNYQPRRQYKSSSEHDINGSLIKNTQGEIVGSALVAQPFTSDRYFNSRKGARSPTPAIVNFD
ncbi:potassium-transporting ATPase subunit C, partial [Fischerella thermalis]|uniref:potassium-transporting ATPase subunit C n=1 Tax=Fischerella thermalis TaxID=372787 RepID=UPI003B968EC8